MSRIIRSRRSLRLSSKGEPPWLRSPLREEHVQHPEQECGIPTRADRQVEVRELRRLRPARIHDDEFCAFADGIAREGTEAHVRLDKNYFRLDFLRVQMAQ